MAYQFKNNLFVPNEDIQPIVVGHGYRDYQLSRLFGLVPLFSFSSLCRMNPKKVQMANNCYWQMILELVAGERIDTRIVINPDRCSYPKQDVPYSGIDNLCEYDDLILRYYYMDGCLPFPPVWVKALRGEIWYSETGKPLPEEYRKVLIELK